MAKLTIKEKDFDASWQKALKEEFKKDYFKELVEFVEKDSDEFTIFPPQEDIFVAFNHTPFDNVKVVLLGQDPYHGPGQAHGLCFSVPEGVKQPPSLKNIFKELNTDLDLPIPKSGNLIKWADQGVLLLNATLTVRQKQAGSHQKRGWENFTDSIIKKIADEKTGVVFIFWGKYAQAKEALIDSSKHLILKAAHPSPFSAHNGFFGCKHFSQANDYLKKNGQSAVDWQLEN